MPPKQRANRARGKSASRIPQQMINPIHQIAQYTRSNQRTVFSKPDVPYLTLVRHVCTFRRSYDTSITQTPGGTDITGALIFGLSSLPNYTEFTNLFDQYRIIQASVRFIPVFLTTTTLYTVIDYDDGSAPTSLSDLDQYDTLTVSESGTIQNRVVNPRPASAVYSGALPFASYSSPSNRLWIDSSSNSVQYYGVKYFIPVTPASTGTLLYRVSISLVVQCQNPH